MSFNNNFSWYNRSLRYLVNIALFKHMKEWWSRYVIIAVVFEYE